MGDAENTLPHSKKRAAGRELTRDNPGLDDEEETSEQEAGTFKKASDEVLAGRKIVKVRRQQTPSAPSSNPFAGVSLVPPTATVATPSEVTVEAESEKKVSDEVDGKDDVNQETEKKKDENTESVNEVIKPELADEKATEVDKTENRENKAPDGEKTEKEDEKDGGSENTEKVTEASPFSSFKQLSSNQNAFTGLSGTGFSSSTFSFGTAPKDGSQGANPGPGSVFGLKGDPPSFPSFGFGLSNNGSALFGTPSIGTKSEGSRVPPMQEVPVQTGEENERAVFSADAVLFEFLDGGWKERGKGELKVNVLTTGLGKARLVMRARGNYRLILNASLYADIKLTNMEKRGITFACMNSTGEGKEGLCTFAVKFKDGSIVEDFRNAVMENKEKSGGVMKTPENSPKASDD